MLEWLDEEFELELVLELFEELFELFELEFDDEFELELLDELLLEFELELEFEFPADATMGVAAAATPQAATAAAYVVNLDMARVLSSARKPSVRPR